MRSWSLALTRFLIVVGLFLVWELASRTGLVNPRLLPPASDVLATAMDLVQRPDFRAGVAVTAAEVFVAFIIAVPVGLVIGIIIAESRYASEVFKPLIFFIFSIPKSIFLPMFILAFGIGFGQKVAFGIFSTVFIVLMTAFAAIESVRADHLRVARSYGATLPQTIARIYLPSMTPVLLEAVRLAMIFNFTGIILAEMYAARAGVGYLIGVWGENFMIRQMLAAILLVAAAAIVFNECVRWLEVRCEHWRA
jgi:ABC-type nitrate/sulfonate/bicarbonate transport system permease component